MNSEGNFKPNVPNQMENSKVHNVYLKLPIIPMHHCDLFKHMLVDCVCHLKHGDVNFNRPIDCDVNSHFSW